MKLVIGAAASGKLTYVRSLGYTDDQMANALLDNSPVIYNLQDLVATLFTEEEDDDKDGLTPAESNTKQILDNRERALSFLEPLLSKEVVVCDEVGAGVIPGNRPERETREATGRLCNRLAQHADSVVRLIAGIPQVIKG